MFINTDQFNINFMFCNIFVRRIRIFVSLERAWSNFGCKHSEYFLRSFSLHILLTVQHNMTWLSNEKSKQICNG